MPLGIAAVFVQLKVYLGGGIVVSWARIRITIIIHRVEFGGVKKSG